MPDYFSPSVPVRGASATPPQADYDCIPSGIAWVDELLGGWRRDRLTAPVTNGYRVSYWRLVEQIARRFVELGGEVDFIGSPLPNIHHPLPNDHEGTGSLQGSIEIARGDWPLVEVLRQAIPPNRTHFPRCVSDLRNMLPRRVGNTKRLIVVSAMDWLLANEKAWLTGMAETRDVAYRLGIDLQHLADDFSAAVVVLAQHGLTEIPKRPTTRWLIRRTILENIDTVGAFVLLTPNPLFLIGAWAYGGRVPGECSRVTLTPTDNGWEKYLRRGKEER